MNDRLTVSVELGKHSYLIVVNSHDLTGLGPFVRQRLPASRQAVVIVDANVLTYAEAVAASLRSSGWTTLSVTVPAGEASKSLEQLGRLYEQLAEAAVDRRAVVVAVGGGVVGDLAGFVAATYNRGLPLVMVPTTLLAMVDSSVGGKTGINLPQGKNLVGAFHQPVGVWIDTACLDTLPEREYRSGLAEVVKYGVIRNAEFFEWIEAHTDQLLARDASAVRHIVAQSCRLKANVVEQDEREETGQRAELNYGHTFAHAFETVGGYGSWLHGEAVAAGMVCASKLAERLGSIDSSATRRQSELLRRFGLPTVPLPEWSKEALLAVMRRDKKNESGQMRFVLPTRIGAVITGVTVEEALVREVL